MNDEHKMIYDRSHSPHCTTESDMVVTSSKGEQFNDDEKNTPQRMNEDHTVVICEEVLKRREILLDMCSTRETEINRKRAEAWDEVHMATMSRCQRKLRLEQIKRVWRHQKNRVRHILNIEKLGSDMELTLEDVIAARKGFMTDYEIAIARAYLGVPPRCRSPSNRRLEELDLSFRKRAATSPSSRIDDSVSSVLDRIAVECAVEVQNQAHTDPSINSVSNVKREPTQAVDQSFQDCNNIFDIHRLLNSVGPNSSTQHKKTTSKSEHFESDDSSSTSENVQPVKRRRTSDRISSIINEQYEMIKAQRVAFEEQAQMYRAMRSFIEESTRTIRYLVGRINVEQQSSAVESSPSESNLEFASGNHMD